MPVKELTIRIPEAEMEAFQRYCAQKGRTQTDVIRGFIWSLIPSKERRRLAGENPLLPTTVQFLRSTVIANDAE